MHNSEWSYDLWVFTHLGNINKALKEVYRGNLYGNVQNIHTSVRHRTAMANGFRFTLSALTLDLFMWNELESDQFQKSFQAFFSFLDESPEGSAANKLRHTDLALNPIKAYVLAHRVTFDQDDEDENIKDDIKVELSKSILLDRICKKIRQFRFSFPDNWELLLRLIDPTPIDVSSALKDNSPYIGRYQIYTLRDVFFQRQIIQRLPKAQELLFEQICKVNYCGQFSGY